MEKQDAANKTSRGKLASVLMLGLMLSASSATAATSIGVNFQGRNETTQVATTPLAPEDVAGVVPQSHWNNVDDNAVANVGTTAPLMDSTGAATPVTLTFNANDSWSNDTDPSTITTPNARMMNGIMKAKTGTSQTLTFNNVPSGTYDVYVYINENGDNAQLTIDDGAGHAFFVTETHQFYDTSRFIQATNTDLGGTPDVGNFVKLQGVTPTDGAINLTVAHILNSDGIGVAGLQLISPSGEIPVTFLSQPISQNAPVGNSVTFGTTLYGTGVKFQWFKNGTAIAGATNAFYSTPTLTTGDNGAKYHVVASNSANSVTSSDATLTVTPATVVPGFLKREYFPNALRTDVSNGTAGAPSFIEAVPSFATPVNDGINNFSERVSGFFTPAVSGDYVFFIAADDDAEFYISTDANPGNKRLVARETGWSNSREWTVSGGGSDLTLKRSDQFSPDGGVTFPFSAGIPLTAGTRYYIEGVHHQGGGGDNFSVTFNMVGEADPVSADSATQTAGDATKLTGSVISFNTTPITSLTIAAQPQNATVTEGFVGSFSVTVETDSELRPKYQWKRNGTPIAGATNSVYSPTVTAADNGAKYTVDISLPTFATTVTSSEATLTVRSPVFTSGFLKYEFWPGKVLADVTNGTAGLPAVLNAISSFQTTNNAGEPSNYADRVSGFFVPETTGNYVFFLGSDDAGLLFLSTDDNPANKKLIAQETGYSGYDVWVTAGSGDPSTKRSDQFVNSAWPTPNVITLTANKRYYIEAAHVEGGGGDWLGAYVKLESEEDPLDGTPSNLTGSRIGFMVAPATVTITQQPAPTSAVEGWRASFNAAATTDSQVKVLSYQWQRNGVDIPNATGPSYTTPPLALSNSTDKYRVKVSAPGATEVTSTEATLAVQAGVLSTGFLKYERWEGKTRADVENNAIGIADSVEALSSLQTANSAGDPPSNYADRVSGFFIPAVSGNYVFFLGSDDDSDLYLSTDANPANKKLIAQEGAYSGYLGWNTAGSGSTSDPTFKRSDQFANSQWPTPNVISLISGQKYYIEVDHHEGTGGDWVGAYVKLESDPDPVDGTPSNLTGSQIGFMAPPATASIAQQPVSATSSEGWSATFSVAGATEGDLSTFTYQWQKNGVNIPGATGASYTTPPLTQANATDKYRVIVGTPGATALTSEEVGVTLTPAAFATGFVKHEVWNGVTDRTLIETGGAGEPSLVEALSSFETPFNAGEPSNYADRLSGFFIPKTSGNYVFFLGSDDDSNLYLSTNDDPANKKLIAQEFGYSAQRSWVADGGNGSLAADKRSDQFSASEWATPNVISLTAGQHYYIEATHHEGGGGDWLGVYAKLSTEPDPTNGAPSNLTGELIGAVGPKQQAGAAELTVSHEANGSVTISWNAPGTLQQATQLTGNAADWTNVTPAPTGSSYTVASPTGNRFFRLKQ